MNFYNENDPKAAAWLRELIAQGLIPPGVVDDRSIKDLKPHDLEGFTQCHFFAGIGGWSLALQLAGWPPSRPVWTGSCPCQPFSTAGKGKGVEDPRHLWPDFRELIRERRPSVVLGEQVASKAGREWLSGVFLDLEGMAYRRAGADLCAAGVRSPNIRQRLFWLADTNLPDQHGRASGGQQPLHECGGSPDWLAHPTGGRFRIDRSPPGSAGHTDELCEACRLAHTEDSNRWSEQQAGRAGCRWCGSPRDGEARPQRVGDSLLAGLEGLGRHGHGGDEPGWLITDTPGPATSPSSAGYWDSFDVIPCRDGKARRIEPGSFPLAHGIPARMGRLRGYGNAINPYVAAAFIASYLEVA